MREEDVHYQYWPKSQSKGAWREKEMVSGNRRSRRDSSMLAHSCPNTPHTGDNAQILTNKTKQSKLREPRVATRSRALNPYNKGSGGWEKKEGHRVAVRRSRPGGPRRRPQVQGPASPPWVLRRNRGPPRHDRPSREPIDNSAKVAVLEST